MAVDIGVGVVAGALLKPATNEIVKRTVGSVYDLLVEKHKLKEISKFKNNYISYCERVLEIKTLMSQDKVFRIDEIFVPVDLLLTGSDTKFEVNNRTALDHERAILIKGLAGQGKSTLLRKLLSNNASYFHRLPIFFELKNYQGGTIEECISDNLSSYGILISPLSLKKLFQDSNVKVFLDAFDEVKPEFRDQLIDDIRRLINGSKCHVICTTRPDTEIETLSDFLTYTVCELTERQVFGIIDVSATDAEKAESLRTALVDSPLYKKSDSILKSPILVVLYCISYNLGEEIPNTLSQFYSNIFDTVFFKHDNIKGKVRRERTWNDNRKIYRNIFDCLCFISMREGLVSFSGKKLIDLVSVALKHSNEEESFSNRVSEELVSITNLIIEDGFNEYRFIHKSIQEFFAASFIVAMEHDKKKGFYLKCFTNSEFNTLFKNTLFFLKELDYYDYHEYGLIPSISDFLSISQHTEIKTIKLPKSLVDLYLDETTISIYISVYRRGKNESLSVEKGNLIFESAINYPACYSEVFNTANSLISLNYSDADFKKLVDDEGVKRESGVYVLTMRQLINFKRMPISSVYESLEVAVNVLYREDFNKAVENIKNRKNLMETSSYFDF
ncbi:NACHT domain-containing protein [Vibrio parahaemolyticus]|nr:NACHT domain-containing protein [Vibrio parahaemolyticus]